MVGGFLAFYFLVFCLFAWSLPLFRNVKKQHRRNAPPWLSLDGLWVQGVFLHRSSEENEAKGRDPD